MTHKRKETAVVCRQQPIATGIYDMWIETSLAARARAGQFINVYTQDKSALLPRPISICEADREREKLRIVYRVSGKGTAEFASYKAGHRIDVLGTLGNGFPLEKADKKRALLIGGGIGIPPLLELAKEITGAVSVDIITGYRSRELFLSDDLAKYGQVHVATEDGSAGIQGNVIDAVNAGGIQGDVIFACGPMPMLRAVKKYAAENGMEAYISLEERMACGVGACLGCVVRTRETDGHSHVNNARICTEGPVYAAEDVEI